MIKRPNKEELEKYNVLYKPDTDFASHARLLQSKWREKKGFKMNDQKGSNYGNFIDTDFAKSEKVNFLTENIRNLVDNKIKEIRAKGGLIGEPRIWNNLLSSQPLCFNLFGELSLDLNLATTFFQRLLPNKITAVTKIDFEYSSKRNAPDNSAFDVYVEYLDEYNLKFIGIEVKYQESLKEESKSVASKTFEKHKSNYERLTEDSGFFIPNAIETLKEPPFSQIWRDHLLSFNMSKDGIIGEFIFLYPYDNSECHHAILNYKKLLINDDNSVNRFNTLDLKYFIKTLKEMHDSSWTTELSERYLGE